MEGGTQEREQEVGVGEERRNIRSNEKKREEGAREEGKREAKLSQTNSIAPLSL